jgi:hypothetical protein
MRRIHRDSTYLLVALTLLATPFCQAAEDSASTAPTATISPAAKPAELTATEIAALKALLTGQQQQIEQLRAALEAQQKLLQKLANQTPADQAGQIPAPSLGEVASLTAVVPAGPVSPSASSAAGLAPVLQTPGPTVKADAVTKRLDELEKKASIGGFKFSGDFRYRLDAQLRSFTPSAAALQNVRGRYRFRLNVDKDLYKGVSAHVQLSTAPFTNETTNDQDFAGAGIKNPFSIAEAWMKYSDKYLTVRGGRMEEAFADNSRFMFDDDIRFDGFDARLKVLPALELRMGEYILTNPNTLIVPAGSPYLTAGYRVGQKLRDATLFDPGFVFKTKIGKGWTQQATGDFLYYRDANQIQLLSTNGTTLAGSAIGVTLSGNIGQTGNAVTTSGGSIYAARYFEILHGGYRFDYGEGLKMFKQSMPFYLDLQASTNTGTSHDRLAYMAAINFGATKKLGDVRFLYSYSYKEASSMISQFTDDDLGTQTGVNTKVHALRLDIGLTKFLTWQNLVFFQNPIAGSRPGFFVTLPVGADTTIRYLGQLAFAF